MAEKRRLPKRRITVPKECYFCSQKKEPWYTDTASLQKFVSDRGKIIVRTRSGLCAKHQRRLTVAIKHARHLALMPFVARD
jgi:small subunit ribosomal protein S18